MSITINGNETAVPTGATVEQMLLANGFSLERIAVEKNGEILRKAAFGSEPVRDGDLYEVVNFVGGG